MNSKGFSRITVVIIVFVVLVVVGVIYQAPERENEISPNDEVFCTQDAKQCPDGSFVGRIPPSCEFAECPSGIDKNTE